MNESIITLENAHAEFKKTTTYLFEKLYEEKNYLQEIITTKQDNSLVSYLQQIQENQYTTTGYQTEDNILSSGTQQNYLNRIILLISEIITRIWKFLKSIVEIYSNQILPDFFDTFITILIQFSKKYKSDPIFPLNSIFTFFTIIGMRNIHAKTFHSLSGAIQWRICSVKWINIPFWENYLQISGQDIDDATREAIQHMIIIAKIMEDDNLSIAQSYADMYKELQY